MRSVQTVTYVTGTDLNQMVAGSGIASIHDRVQNDHAAVAVGIHVHDG